jgi:hypothetical protein
MPALEIEAPYKVNTPEVTFSDVEAPIVRVAMDADPFRTTGLFVALRMSTTAVLLLGAVFPFQLVPVNQRSETLPFHVCPNAGAEEKHASAKIPSATGIQPERCGIPRILKKIAKKIAFIASSPSIVAL